MTNKERTDSTVVPIGRHAFSEVLKTRIYYFPQTKKKNKNIKYIFFYRVKPIQAITHYGIIERQVEDADKLITVIEKMKSFKDPSKKASAYELLKIEKLKNNILFDKSGTSVQGRINGNFHDIIQLKTTRGLFKQKQCKI